MNNDAGGRSRVILHLLGQLQDTEKIDVERRKSVDPAYADFCNDVEEELIDSYLQGELSAEDADRFRRYYLITSERQRKVEFTRALSKTLNATRSRSAVWNALGGAGIALALAAVTWLVLAPPPAAVASFTLSPGVVRTLGTSTILNISKGVLLIDFQLEPESRLMGHRVVLRAQDSSEEIWSQRIEPTADGRFHLQIPGTLVQSGDYILTMQNGSDIVASYFFRLVKQ